MSLTCELSTFLIRIQYYNKNSSICLGTCGQKQLQGAAQQNRCAQLDPKQNRHADLDPSQARNVSEEIEFAYRSLSETEKKQDKVAETVFAKIASIPNNLFCRYFNPDKHRYLIHNSIQDYLKFAPLRARSMSPMLE